MSTSVYEKQRVSGGPPEDRRSEQRHHVLASFAYLIAETESECCPRCLTFSVARSSLEGEESRHDCRPVCK